MRCLSDVNSTFFAGTSQKSDKGWRRFQFKNFSRNRNFSRRTLKSVFSTSIRLNSKNDEVDNSLNADNIFTWRIKNQLSVWKAYHFSGRPFVPNLVVLFKRVVKYLFSYFKQWFYSMLTNFPSFPTFLMTFFYFSLSLVLSCDTCYCEVFIFLERA